MPLHLATSYETAAMQESSREARRFLNSKVRNNWEYPPLPEWAERTPHPLDRPAAVTSALEDSSLDMPTSAWEEQQGEDLNFEPIAWKERDYSSSSSVDECSAAEFMDLDEDQPKHKHRFLFDSPDTVGEAMAARKENRKRKRAQVLEEEMAWNTGLAHFIARRNAWTCARQPSQVPAPSNSSSSTNRPSTSSRHRLSVGSRGASSRASAESATPSLSSHHTPDLETHHSPTPSTPASTPPPPSEPGPASLRTVIPIPPPMLPDHPVRSKITSATYSEIYSKIILQSRTPTVPINLGHITKSLVRGWIEEGNWPPKQGAVDPLVGKKKGKGEKHHHISKGVKAVGRVLGLGIGSDEGKR
ncbi:hypothetical protein B9Z65_528 [Elsinoe australis]|uniref:Gag1-like clamp domain-containing protein n=1 Tax=Elsinoe australis TaxID=40998 RepID=A0A2P8AIR7_9PEZI|nr:hypothetical protein B9Z65_528 [Elsinoe australis]